MAKLRFALLGAGFWSYYQLCGWRETGEAECTAIYDLSRERALRRAQQFNLTAEAVYDDLDTLLSRQPFDFADVCSSPESHEPLVKALAGRGVPVVCQKPMALTLDGAAELVRTCKAAGVPFYVNENFRWQTPIRALKARIDSGRIGTVFRARLDFRTRFPVFQNQPYLKDVEQFILADVGVHILDVARFLFGETESLYCRTQHIIPGVKGEDTATVMLTTERGASVLCVMSFATHREHDGFPQTYAEVEGERGFLELAPDYWLRETTADGTFAQRCPPPRYGWADPAYDVVHASIVGAQTNIARALQGSEVGETSGEDNLKTLRLVFQSYESAARGQVVRIGDMDDAH